MKTVEKYLVCALIVALCLGGVSGCGSSSNTTSESESQSSANNDVTSESERASYEGEYGELDWPTFGIAALIPTPESKYGEVTYDSSEFFDAYVADTYESEYKAYVTACQEAGFTLDYESSDTLYLAFNEDRYEVWVNYDEDEEVMEIEIYAPYETYEETESEEESKTSEEVSSNLSWPTTGLGALVPDPESSDYEIGCDEEWWFYADVYDYTESDYSNYVQACKDAGFTVNAFESEVWYEAYNTVGNEIIVTYDEESVYISVFESSDTESEEESEPASEANEDLVDGMRPEIKEAIDSYVDFFESYCEFMESYDSSDWSMLAEYTEFLGQYYETMDKMSAMEDEDLNDAELAYYIDATAEIEKMLLDVSDY